MTRLKTAFSFFIILAFMHPALPGCACSGETILAGDAWNDNFRCEERNITINPVIPEVLIMLDRSNSMGYDEFWDPTREAVIGIVEAYDETLMFGLAIFPDQVCRTTDTDEFDCIASSSPDVPIAFNSGNEISSFLMSMWTCGGTPVAETLMNMHGYLSGRPEANPKTILLATDGAPNCNEGLDGYTCRCTCLDSGECAICTTPFNKNCLDDIRTYAALDALLEDGVKTYVIGLSRAAVDWGDILQAMAGHGGTGSFYAAENPGQVREIFETITSLVSECEFALDATQVLDPELVNIYFDSSIVPMDPESVTGWSWVGENRIVFYGSSCNRIIVDEVETIEATYGCPTVIIEP